MSEPQFATLARLVQGVSDHGTTPQALLDRVLSDARPAEAVAQLSEQSFYYLVRGLGLADSAELLALATGEQLRGCLDFEVWDRDEVVIPRLEEWLSVMVEEFLPGRLLRALEALDIELLALWIRRRCKINDRTLDETAEGEGPRYLTPDSFFEFHFLPETDANTALLIERLFERLYDADQEFARRLIQEAKWGLDSELKESAYRWRRGRMEDLGFFEYYEALEAYAYLPAEKAFSLRGPWRSTSPRQERVDLPLPLQEGIREVGFFVRVLRSITDTRLLDDLAEAFLAVTNRVLSADRVDPADIDRVREVSKRVVATLSVGLERLSEGNVERAKDILMEIPQLVIFRVGFSETAELGKLAQQIHQRGIDDPNLDPLLERRPLYPLAFDDVPRSGSRPFASMADVERVRRYLREVHGVLGSEPSPTSR